MKEHKINSVVRTEHGFTIVRGTRSPYEKCHKCVFYGSFVCCNLLACTYYLRADHRNVYYHRVGVLRALWQITVNRIRKWLSDDPRENNPYNKNV